MSCSNGTALDGQSVSSIQQTCAVQLLTPHNGMGVSTAQVVYSFDAEGGIPKVVANKLAVDTDGSWLLPFWRENE